MLKRSPGNATQTENLDDPLDGYPVRQPYYTLGFLLLQRQAAPTKEAVAESDSLFPYGPKELNGRPERAAQSW